MPQVCPIINISRMKFRKWSTFFSIVLTLIYTVWWVWLALFVPQENDLRNNFSLTYGVLAGYGGIIGFVIAKKWGGFKSYVGKSLIFFAFGLFCQFLGQNSYSIQFLIDHVENAYPSYGEIFFLASIPSYIIAVWFIAKAAGSGTSLKSIKSKLLAFIIPLLMVAISYYMFIKGTSMEGQSTIAVILNFVYPIGEAIFVSVAIVAYLLSKRVLGGVMKRRVVFILFSLAFQYAADSLFLYKCIQGTWYHADFSEFMFAISYALMTFAFLDFASVFGQLKGKD